MPNLESKNADIRNPEKNINDDSLAAILKDIREPKKDTRKQYLNEVLDTLKYRSAKPVSIHKQDALLIKAATDKFGEKTSDLDIVLMAFGLLDGYYYNKMKSIQSRRAKYLRKSYYLSDEPFSYDDADDNRKRDYRERLRKTGEENNIKLLAAFLLKQKDITTYINEIDDYIDKGTGMPILPKPGYLEQPEPIIPKTTKENEKNERKILRINKTIWLLVGLSVGLAFGCYTAYKAEETARQNPSSFHSVWEMSDNEISLIKFDSSTNITNNINCSDIDKQDFYLSDE